MNSFQQKSPGQPYSFSSPQNSNNPNEKLLNSRDNQIVQPPQLYNAPPLSNQSHVQNALPTQPFYPQSVMAPVIEGKPQNNYAAKHGQIIVPANMSITPNIKIIFIFLK